MDKRKKPIIGMQAQVKIIEAAEGESRPPKFQVVAYTGTALEVNGYDAPVVINLDGMTYGKSIVANLDHDRTKRVGNVTERSTDGGELRLGGIASAATDARREVVESASNGFVWQASIEARPRKLAEVKAGKSVTVNGRDFEGPLYVAEQSELKGFAFVSHGADDDTLVSIAASAAEEGKKVDAQLKEFIEGIGFDPDELTEDQLAGLEANYRGQQAPKKKKTEEFTSAIEKTKAEAKRKQEITEIALRACDDHPHDIEAIHELGQQAVDEKWTSEKFQLELLKACIPQGHTVFSRRSRKTELSAEVLEAAIVQSGNRELAEKSYDEQVLEACDKRYPHGISLKQIFIDAANANGMSHTGSSVDISVQRAAFGMVPQGRQIQASAFSTLSLPGILSNVANKFLLNGWMGGDQTWRTISGIKSAGDFKQMTSYRLSGHLKYMKVAGDGEIKHGETSEDAYLNKVDTYGRMYAVTREDIVNDDLGALTTIPMELGQAAIDKFNDVFWTEFLDNATFFAVGNNNVVTGAGSVLGLDGLQAAEKVFLEQKKPNGEPLAVMGQVLLVPPALWATARQLMNSLLLITGQDATQGNANVFQGQYTAVTTPYLGAASGITGGSDTAWYLLNRDRYPTIESAFLNNRQSPIVETADADFNVLGVQMRGYHDFGARKQEPRGGVRAAGA